MLTEFCPKYIKRQSGFTLIELLVTMAIVATLMGLVGPLAMDSLNRARATEEQLTLTNWIKQYSYRSFAVGRPAVIQLKDNQVSINYRQAPPIGGSRNPLSPGFDSAEPSVSKQFQHLTFLPQELLVNRHGFVSPAQVELRVRGRRQVLDLNEKVNGQTK